MIFTKGKIIALVLVILMGLSLVSLAPGAQADTVDWVLEGQIPGERSAFVWAELPDGRIFMGLGFNSSSYQYRNDSWILDPFEMTWTRMADAPYGMVSTTAAYLEGKVYVFGGFDSIVGPTTNVLIYDVDANAWSTGPALPATSSHMKCVAVDERHILVVGGESSSWVKCYLFDVETQIFNTADDLPDGRAGGTLVTVADIAYYFGGWTSGYVTSDSIFGYDVVNDNWWTADELPEPMAGMAGVLGSDGLIYLLGGALNPAWGGANTEQAIAWDPVDKQFIDLPDLAEPLRFAAPFELADGRIMYFGGHNDDLGNQNVYSIKAWNIEATLDSDTVGQGESAWLSLNIHTNFAKVNDLYGTVYLMAMGVTFATYYIESQGGMVSLEIPISQETQPLGYVLVFSDVGSNWVQDFTIEPLALTVTDTPSMQDRLNDLQEQNHALQDQLNETRDELKEATDAKLDAMIGYIILIIALGALVVGVIILVRKK
ncbi:MAG: hypothetical protein NT131_03555 [Methanomassiliicoccales archaeon]|nr:hypothetical protein [Methanomassiliicoccales archaeon]